MADSTSWKGSRAAEPQVPFDIGYDAALSGIQASDVGANAYLVDSGDNTHIFLHIVETRVDLALSGQTAQAQTTRDFYARNFAQPTFAFTCQAPSQLHMGRISEFVHKAQRNAVAKGSLLTFILPPDGLRNTAAGTHKNGMKGTRSGIHMTGYISDMPREHRRHDPAPTYTFNFTVARMQTGIFHEQAYKAYRLLRWSEIVDALIADNFVKPPKTVDEEIEAEQLDAAGKVINEFIQVGTSFADLLTGG